MKAIDKIKASYAKMFPEKETHIRLVVNNSGDINVLGPNDQVNITLNTSFNVNNVEYKTDRVMRISFKRTSRNKYDLIINVPAGRLL
jgi:hypothetical protein